MPAGARPHGRLAPRQTEHPGPSLAEAAARDDAARTAGPAVFRLAPAAAQATEIFRGFGEAGPCLTASPFGCSLKARSGIEVCGRARDDPFSWLHDDLRRACRLCRDAAGA